MADDGVRLTGPESWQKYAYNSAGRYSSPHNASHWPSQPSKRWYAKEQQEKKGSNELVAVRQRRHSIRDKHAARERLGERSRRRKTDTDTDISATTETAEGTSKVGKGNTTRAIRKANEKPTLAQYAPSNRGKDSSSPPRCPRPRRCCGVSKPNSDAGSDSATATDSERRNGRIPQARLASSTAADTWAKTRSRSKAGKSRERSKVQTGVAIAAASLEGAHPADDMTSEDGNQNNLMAAPKLDLDFGLGSEKDEKKSSGFSFGGGWAGGRAGGWSSDGWEGFGTSEKDRKTKITSNPNFDGDMTTEEPEVGSWGGLVSAKGKATAENEDTAAEPEVFDVPLPPPLTRSEPPPEDDDLWGGFATKKKKKKGKKGKKVSTKSQQTSLKSSMYRFLHHLLYRSRHSKTMILGVAS